MTEAAAGRIRAIRPDSLVIAVGSTDLDALAQADLTVLPAVAGYGVRVDLRKPYVVVMLHPVTAEYSEAYLQAATLIGALRTLRMPAVVFNPNQDVGSEEIVAAYREWRERENPRNVMFVKNLPPIEYARLLNHCARLIGNSSSGVKEGAFMGVPYVLVDNRQQGREVGRNVMRVGWDAGDIVRAARWQVDHGKYEQDLTFGRGDAGVQIADTLAGLI